MPNGLAAFSFALLAVLGLVQGQGDKPGAQQPQDDLVEMRWDVKLEERYEFKWKYTDDRNQKPGVGVAVELHDTREVDAELVPNQDSAASGRIPLVLKKVQWTTATQDYSVTLTYQEGKKPIAQVQIKADPKKPNGQVAKNEADLHSEAMKKQMESQYVLDTSPKRKTVILADGQMTPPFPSVFDKCYLHSQLPNGSVRLGQKWKDPLDQLPVVAAGSIEVKMIEYSVGPMTPAAVTVKAGFNAPLIPPAGGFGVTPQTVTGDYRYNREYTFHRLGYLQGSKEETAFNKKTDAKGKDADFYRDTTSHTIKQTLAIKKRNPPKPPDEKKEEKK